MTPPKSTAPIPILILILAAAAVADDIPPELQRRYREVFAAEDREPRLELIAEAARRDDEGGARLLVEIVGRNDGAAERGLYRKRAGFGQTIDGIFERAIRDKRMLTADEDRRLQTVKAGQAAVDAEIDAIVEVRWRAAEALEGLTDPGARAYLLGVAADDRDWFVRYAAVRAVGTAGDPDPVDVLRRIVADDDEPMVRSAALDALGRRRASAAFDEAVAALEDRAWPVRASAAAALAWFGDLRAVKALVDRIAGEDGRLRTDLDDALHALTGFTMGGDAARWASWWQVHGASIADGSFVRKGEPGPPGVQETGVTFYGIRTLSNRIVFVLDISMSMKNPAGTRFPVTGGDGVIEPEGDRKIDVARAQLKNALRALPDGAEFNIVFYRQGVEVLSPRMVRRTDRNVSRAFEFIDGQRPAGGTNLFDALHQALNPAEVVDSGARITDRNYDALVDTVFLLSDGEPNYGRLKTNGRMLAEIRRLNGYRKVVLHAIGIGEHNESFMKGLAEATGGEYAGYE